MGKGQSLYLQVISYKLLMTSELFALFTTKLTYIHLFELLNILLGTKTMGTGWIEGAEGKPLLFKILIRDYLKERLVLFCYFVEGK